MTEPPCDRRAGRAFASRVATRQRQRSDHSSAEAAGVAPTRQMLGQTWCVKQVPRSYHCQGKNIFCFLLRLNRRFIGCRADSPAYFVFTAWEKQFTDWVADGRVCSGDCCPVQVTCYTGTSCSGFDPTVIKLRQSARLNVRLKSFVSIVTPLLPDMS